MDCKPGQAHHWDLNQTGFGVCRHCNRNRQFGRPWEPRTLTWAHRAQTKPTQPGRPPQTPLATVAPAPRHNMHVHPGKSGFFGVTKWKSGWKARLCVDRKQMHLGLFATAVEAARKYNDVARRYLGARATLNELPGESGDG